MRPTTFLVRAFSVALFVAAASAASPTAGQQAGPAPVDPELKRLEGQFLERYLTGKALEGEPYVRELFEKAQRQDPPDRAAYATELMALSLIAQHRLAEVPPLYEAMLGFLRERLGQLHPDIPRLHLRLANFLASVGRPDAAEPHFRAASALLRQILGEQDPDYARVLLERAANLEILGQPREAEQLYRQTISIIERHFGKETELAGMAWERLAMFYDTNGRPDDALKAWGRSKEILAALTGGQFVRADGPKATNAAAPGPRPLPSIPERKPPVPP